MSPKNQCHYTFLILTVKHLRGLKTKVLLIFRFFSTVIVAKYGRCNHDFRKEIELFLFFFSIIVLNMMMLLSVIHVKADKTMIKESYSAR